MICSEAYGVCTREVEGPLRTGREYRILGIALRWLVDLRSWSYLQAGRRSIDSIPVMRLGDIIGLEVLINKNQVLHDVASCHDIVKVLLPRLSQVKPRALKSLMNILMSSEWRCLVQPLWVLATYKSSWTWYVVSICVRRGVTNN